MLERDNHGRRGKGKKEILSFFVSMGLSVIPFIGKAAGLIPGWLLWLVSTAAWYRLTDQSSKQQKLKIDENGLSCWIGEEWKFSPWDSISRLHITEIANRHGGYSNKRMEITDQQGTFTYDISVIVDCGKALRLMHTKLGDRITHSSY
jgi:hypothetical protein